MAFSLFEITEHRTVHDRGQTPRDYRILGFCIELRSQVSATSAGGMEQGHHRADRTLEPTLRERRSLVNPVCPHSHLQAAPRKHLWLQSTLCFNILAVRTVHVIVKDDNCAKNHLAVGRPCFAGDIVPDVVG